MVILKLIEEYNFSGKVKTFKTFHFCKHITNSSQIWKLKFLNYSFEREKLQQKSLNKKLLQH
jgi:hypothetical protein